MIIGVAHGAFENDIVTLRYDSHVNDGDNNDCDYSGVDLSI